MIVEFTVYGRPAPQGSKAALGRRGNGSVILKEMSPYVGPWRDSVRAAALTAYAQYGGPPLDEPLILMVLFTLKAPQKMPKGRVFPTTIPDLSKLVRSTEDAITDAGIWRDDSLVVSTVSQKLYVGQPGALDRPGAWINILPMESDLVWWSPVTSGVA